VQQLRNVLERVEGRGYKAYKALAGRYEFPDFELFIDHVQGDPFAEPSRIRVRVSIQRAGIPDDLYATRTRRIALEDFIGRSTAAAIRREVRGERGIGKSGEIAITTSAQQVLVRDAVRVADHAVELRMRLGLPARGRTILAREAEAMLFTELPAVIGASLLAAPKVWEAARRHVDSVDDQAWLRGWLALRRSSPSA